MAHVQNEEHVMVQLEFVNAMKDFMVTNVKVKHYQEF